MMEVLATPDELALKQQVTAALAEQGVLAKIKAELRAAVFRVMHDRAMPPTSDKSGPALSAFPAEVAATTMELVSECFAFFQWNHSLLVLRAEADLESSTDLPLRGNKLAEKLGLRGEPDTPALLQLVQERLARHEEKQISVATVAPQPQVEDFGVTSAALRFRSASLARQDEANEEKQKDLTEEESHSIEEESISEDEEAADEDEEERDTPKGRDSEVPSVIRQEIDHKEGRVDVARSSNTFTTGKFQVHESDEDEDEDEEDNYVTQQTAAVSPASTKTEENDADEENCGTEKAKVKEGAIKNEEDEGDEEVELEESVMEESIADDYASASDFESSVDPVNTTPSTLPPLHRGDEENEALPPPVPTRMMPPPHPLDSVALSTPGSDHEDDDLRDDDFDPEEEAARLSSLDAKLKAMEAEDDTGTLQQLKASLQLELQRETDGDADEDGDGDGYGSSDFEEEEEIASEVSEEVDSMAQESEEEEEDEIKSKKPGGDEDKQELAVPTELQDDRAVASEDVLNSYDYVEPVERPW